MVAAFLDKANSSNPPMQLKGAFKIILDEEPGASRYQNFFNEARTRKEKWTWWFEGIEFGSKKMLPLQMADLLAHQSWHRARDIARDSRRPVRPVFARMLRGDHIEMQQLTERDAEANARLFREILKTHPEGLLSNSELADLRGAKAQPTAWRRFTSWLTRWWRRLTRRKTPEA